jgi:alpha-tubulin suppressor-like RCC1 family protein
MDSVNLSQHGPGSKRFNPSKVFLLGFVLFLVGCTPIILGKRKPGLGTTEQVASPSPSPSPAPFSISVVVQSPNASTVRPAVQFSVLGVSSGDRIMLLRNADSQCSGGSIVNSFLATSSTYATTVSDGYPLYHDIRSAYRILIHQATGERVCSAPSASYDLPTLKMQRISAGGDFSCGMLPDQKIKCWGRNHVGQLGNGSTVTSPSPVQVSGIETALQISSGMNHSCALLPGGTIKCWGLNSNGQLGNGTTMNSSVPVLVSGITSAIQVSAGGYHSCATLSDTSIRCWGSNFFGQLGDGTTTQSTVPKAVLLSSDSQPLQNVAEVSSGSSHTCARLGDASVACWGDHFYGQLGSSSISLSGSTKAISVPGLSSVQQISTRGRSTCSLLEDGSVRCWGSNTTGQLGNGTLVNSTTPVAVSNLTNVAKVIVGTTHACAILAQGTVRCWGNNGSGQLGDGTKTNATLPLQVASLTGVIEGALGDQHSCAILTEGSLVCWGSNSQSQLGSGINAYRAHSPLSLSLAQQSPVEQVASSLSHSCAVLIDGRVSCWGQGSLGRLGNGGIASSETPVSVLGISQALQVSVGMAHSCAVISDGSVWCWGYNGNGELGVGGGPSSSSVPMKVRALAGIEVEDLKDVIQVSTGQNHSCAVLSDQTVRCWGVNSLGQLGIGTHVNSSVAAAVPGLTGVIKVSAAADHSCALLEGGNVKCWGWNDSGQLGDGTQDASSSPVDVAGISGASDLQTLGWTCGEDMQCAYSCALVSGGALMCWGDVVSIGSSRAPVAAVNLTGIVGFSMSREHGCAVRSDFRLWCWGDNTSGQLGDGSFTFASHQSPRLVDGVGGVSSVSVRIYGACALQEGGALWCWGTGPEYGESALGFNFVRPLTIVEQ